jgi:hypothetical protein
MYQASLLPTIFVTEAAAPFEQIIFENFNGSGIWQKCAKIWRLA